MLQIEVISQGGTLFVATCIKNMDPWNIIIIPPKTTCKYKQDGANCSVTKNVIIRVIGKLNYRFKPRQVLFLQDSIYKLYVVNSLTLHLAIV